MGLIVRPYETSSSFISFILKELIMCISLAIVFTSELQDELDSKHLTSRGASTALLAQEVRAGGY